MAKERVLLPPVPLLESGSNGYQLRQWSRGPVRELQTVGVYRSGKMVGLLLTGDAGKTTLVVPAAHTPTMTIDTILVCPNPNRVLGAVESHFIDPKVAWARPSVRTIPFSNLSTLNTVASEARLSWHDAFSFKEERKDSAGRASEMAAGLRQEQMVMANSGL